MKQTHGFTVIEILIAIVLIGIAATVLFIQKNDLAAAQRDDQRKTAINAMYYNLEEVYFPKDGYYPSKIDSTTLKAMDPALFTDPTGIALGDAASDYHYDGLNCNNNQCKGYKLSADMEKEAEYVKMNRNKS